METSQHSNSTGWQRFNWTELHPSNGIFNWSNSAPWLISRLRIFLYLSDPREESFESVDQVADYHSEVFPLLASFVLLEWLILWLKGRPLPKLGDSAASTSMIIYMQATRILTRGLEHSAYIYIYNNYRIVDLPWDSPYTWYLAAIFIDLCYYWGHRLSHEINFLWAHHQAHHSAETYSLVNVFRLPFTQDWLYAFCYLPIAFIIPPSHYLVHLQLNLLYQFWLHTEVVGRLGPLEWIFNTPSHHRVHHGANKYCLDKNYGAWLIIWDRMFGTFEEERSDEEIVYGLVDQVQSFNPLYLQVFYVGKIYDKWKSMDGWKNKLYSVIKGPGWRPGTSWTGDINEVPEVRGRKAYTGKNLPFYLLIYMFMHFIIVLIAYEAVCLFQNRLSPIAVVCHLSYVLFSMTTTGMFFDGHRLAPVFEFARCTFFFLYSLRGVPLLESTLTWIGLVDVYGPSVVTCTIIVLRIYFVMSAIVWSIIPALNVSRREFFSVQKKLD